MPKYPLGMMLLITIMVHCQAHASVDTDDSYWSFSIGAHQNWLYGDDYYEFGGALASNKERHKMGWEAGLFYDASAYLSNWFISFELMDLGRLGSNASTCDNNLACFKRTEIEQTWLMANAYYLIQKNKSIAFYAFTGGAYVFSEGEVLDQAWDNNALGAQVGMKLVLHEPTDFDPLIGMRISRLDVESTDEIAHIYNLSVFFGIQY